MNMEIKLNNWFEAYFKNQNYKVDLSDFKYSSDYKDFFDSIITFSNRKKLENKFKKAVEECKSFEVAGEVYFWENYDSPNKRNILTKRLLDYFDTPNNWKNFIDIIKNISEKPTFDNFEKLKNACGQPLSEFRTPIIFLAFYDPLNYPMVDKHIANWWKNNKEKYTSWWEDNKEKHKSENHPNFFQNKDGFIETHTESQRRQNWHAYLAWSEFCRKYSIIINDNWRARDVEKTVWEAQKYDISLEVPTAL